MGPQDSNDEHQRSNEEAQQHRENHVSGRNGQGAGSALEAMLRNRQMRVNTEPDPAAAPVTQKQDGKTDGE